jgi:hypothetical protein
MSSDPEGTEFIKETKPTKFQRRAFELLGV